MATIVPNQDFLHGKDKFKKGKSYEVDDGPAFYFAMNGWLEGSDVKGLPEDVEVTLNVDSVKHGHKAQKAGE